MAWLNLRYAPVAASAVVGLTALLGATAAPSPTYMASRSSSGSPSLGGEDAARQGTPSPGCEGSQGAQDPADLLRRGAELESAGQPDRAMLCYERAHQRGMASRDFAAASAALRARAVLTSRQDPVRDASEAIRLLEEALALDTDYHLKDSRDLSSLTLARVLLARGLPEDQRRAEGLYRDLGGDQTNLEALMVAQVGLAQTVREAQGDSAGALEILRVPLAHWQREEDLPRQADLHYRMGLRQVDLRQFAAARASFERSRSLWSQAHVAQWYNATPTQRAGLAQVGASFAAMAELDEVRADLRPGHTDETSAVAALGRQMNALSPAELTSAGQIFAQITALGVASLQGEDIDARARQLALQPNVSAEQQLWLHWLRFSQRSGERAAAEQIAGEVADVFHSPWCNIPVLRVRLNQIETRLEQLGARDAEQEVASLCDPQP